ncbi:FMN reductase [Aeromicrobium sp. PE09-221]|nr:FMN reductase [Aeromicrobium sp. PE09-221]
MTDTAKRMRVLMVIGSVRTGRFGHVPASWLAERARLRDDIELAITDLADLDLPADLGDKGRAAPSDVTALGDQIEAADAIVIVTPVYNRGYPASLKNAIDWFNSEWSATPVGFVSYGGRTGGIEAVEQLRTVFVELGTMTIRNVLSFPDFWEVFDESGVPADPARVSRAAGNFYDELIWWARALRPARLARQARR